jgi:SPP1 family predicted phage head-tail adaptor
MSVVFKAGDYRKLVTIQQRSLTQDSYGGQSETWSDVMTVWASIEPLSSRELMAAQAVQSETTHQIRIRYMPGITADMRAVYNGRYFNLARPLNTEERNIELVIPAIEGLNRG